MLRERGHEVFIGGEHPENPRSRIRMAQEQGFPLLYAKEPNYAYAWDRFEKYGWLATAWDLYTHNKWAPLGEILEGHVKLIQREKPDLVIGDATISVSTAAYITGVPAAGIMNAYAAEFVAPTSIFGPMIYTWDALHLARIRRRVFKKYGVEPVNAIRLLKSIPLLSPDLEGFYDMPRGWDNWHMVGPVLTEPPVGPPDWLAELDDGQTNIYISMGTTGILDTFLRRTYAALGKTPYRFIVTTGGQADSETIAMAPPNFRFATYAPGRQLLKHCKAIIFHAGNGTMYQAVEAGVPMIVLPSHLEQNINADLIVKRGFGFQFKPRRVRGDKLVTALHALIEDPRYAEACGRYSDGVRTGNGPQRAADILENIARQGLPAGHNLR